MAEAPATGDADRDRPAEGHDRSDDSTADRTATPAYDAPNPDSKEFGLRGWALVVALVVAFLVIPWTIIALPGARNVLETLPLGWRDAYLVLPFVPAVFLGALGVWTAVANRRE